MFCRNCGKEIPNGAKFCTSCGTATNVNKKKGSIPIIAVVAVVVLVAIGFLVKNMFLGGSIAKNVRPVTSYSENTLVDDIETVKFGSYDQSNSNEKEPIEWIVLDRQGNRTLLLSKYILDCKCYENSGNNTIWETCSLRNWLNSDFYYNAFNSSEQNKILMTNVVNNDNIDYGTSGGPNTQDKIFCLSIEEVRKYFGQGTKEKYGYQLGKNVATRGTNHAKNVDNYGSKLWVLDASKWYGGNSSFWLRSPGSYQNYASGVNYDGYLLTYGTYVGNSYTGVRPALCISD